MALSLICVAAPSSLFSSSCHVRLKKGQGRLWINFAALALDDNMSSKTRGARIIMLVILRELRASPPQHPDEMVLTMGDI